MRLHPRDRFNFDTRTYADVVKGATSQPLNNALLWRTMLDAVEAYQRQWNFCPRVSNFFKVYVLTTFAQTNKASRFYRTLEWRRVFYTCRERIAFFYKNRAKLETIKCQCANSLWKIPRAVAKHVVPCNQRHNEVEQIEELGRACKRLRGPHSMDLFVFMHLSRRARLGNDLALFIFDFL